ncbi:MAG TPA: hypothetical protein VN803_06865 [Gemmatimonadales bacterium]|nr:hypothetical protein [Gemmatimonadales bacterium]
MALVSFLPAQRVEIPHEPGNWIEFRKPSGAVVREARRVVESEGRKGVRDFGAEIVKAFTGGDDDDAAVRRTAKLAKQQEYDPSSFDRTTLLAGCALDGKDVKGAIVAWGGDSYTGADGKAVPVMRESVDDLDEATAQWAHEYVVGLMKPPTPEVDKSPAAAAAPGA